jgi:phage terminase large subunit-like protein
MFDSSKADKVINFIKNLTHTKGKWAGKPFQLLPWQEAAIRAVYGTINNNIRQYRMCYIEIPKKNGKTELLAAIALYMLCADGEDAPEVYSAAADREQAGLIYMVASQMVRNSKELSNLLKIRDSRKRIINPKKNGFYQVLSSDVKTKHGLNPSCVLFDELHAQPTDELWRVLTAGTDYARTQQLVFIATTAGIYDINSIWWRVREKARQVSEEIIEDKTFYPVLFIADPDKDKVDDEEVWKRVNPSLGRIFTIEKIREDYNISKNDAIGIQDFKRFRLNIPIKQLKRWLDINKWDECRGDIEDLTGQIAFGGVDLSSTQDLTAFVLVFPRSDGAWKILCKSYCPEEIILKKSQVDRVHYDIWAEQGFITPTPGDFVDFSYGQKDIIEASEKYILKEVGYDPWAAAQMAGVLQNDYGIQMIKMRQGAITLSEPSKAILKAILSKNLIHDGNPILRWCADNVVMIVDHNENIRPAKDKSTGRIDLFVALIMAWGRAMQSVDTSSVYEKRGVLEI